MIETKQLIKELLTKKLTELDQKRIVGGVLIKCVKTDRVLLLLRNDETPVWALMSGGIEKGENVLNGLKREIGEELSIDPKMLTFKFVRIEHITEKNLDFFYYQAFTNMEFKPILDHENLKYQWFSKDKLPNPLYKGLAEKIASI